MNWIIPDLLMFFSSVLLYLAVRKATLQKLPLELNNFTSFLIPLVTFPVVALFLGDSFAITATQAILLLLTGVFFAYFPNKMLLRSIDLAPNPGYSLIISKSYVVLTTFLAVPLFGAHLSWTALIAITLIVGFSALILVNPKVAKRAKSNAWLPFALGAFFGWGILSLMAKHLFLQGLSSTVFLTYLSLVVVVCVMIEMKRKKMSMLPTAKQTGIFLLVGVGAALFNFFGFYAIDAAPNIGYVNATNAASIGAVTVFSILIFHDEFSWRKIIGVFGVIGGLILLFLG